jgi:MFS family permease
MPELQPRLDSLWPFGSIKLHETEASGFYAVAFLYTTTMNTASRRVVRIYLILQFGNTLAASLIWGINTLFLLSTGLSNFETFLANAFFTLGMVLFEIPTGIVADSRGRRISYLLGTVTLGLSTLLYYLLWVMHAPFWEWASTSLLLGLGFTFFSGAVEAWLVDALDAAKFRGSLEAVFGKGQMVNGAAMLVGTLSGGALAQVTNLGIPYVARGMILLLLFMLAWRLMHDEGFTPERTKTPLRLCVHCFISRLIVDYEYRQYVGSCSRQCYFRVLGFMYFMRCNPISWNCTETPLLI